MTPSDLIVWAFCFMIASIPFAMGIAMIGMGLAEGREAWKKAGRTTDHP